MDLHAGIFYITLYLNSLMCRRKIKKIKEY